MEANVNSRARFRLGLACIVIVYLFSVFRFNPTNLFGLTQDDSIYFSSAQALANHQGYILPSVPGTPAATKYPIFYPWLLSWVWRIQPSFPANLHAAMAVTAAFGVLFLIATFTLLRQMEGLGNSAPLMITLFVALHPVLQLYSSSILSDVPFAALAMLAILAGDYILRPAASDPAVVGAALLAGSCVLMRVFGVPIAVGILAALVARRAWKKAAIFSAGLLPFFAGIAWRQIFSATHASARPAGIASIAPGFAAAWSYYTSYPGFWKLSLPNTQIFWAMLKNNAIFMLHSPSDYFLFPLLARDTFANRSLMVLVSAVILAGIVRQARASHWRTVHFVLPLYAGLALLWNYPDPTGRFFLLFLPLFCVGFWVEGRHLFSLVRTVFAAGRAGSEKVIAGLLACGVVTLLCGIAWNYGRTSRGAMSALAVNRATLLQDKVEAYRWISESTSQNAVIISYEDAALYLYTGRQAMRAAAFTTAGLYNPAYLNDSIAHMTDVACATHAQYWLSGEDDFALEGESAVLLARSRERELESSWPLAFQSRDGRVRVYRLPFPSR